MGAFFNINADAAVVMTNKLEKLHRSALPVAVRQTLNSAAFDVKQVTLLKVSKATFEERREKFFSGTSRVQKAKGFLVTAMSSQVGFTGAEKNQAVRDLEQQERGGKIGGRSFVPLKGARKAQSDKNVVEPKFRTTKMKNIIRAGRQKGGTRGVRFIKAAIKAGKGGNVIGTNQIVYRITRLRKTTKNVKLKVRAIYDFKKGREVKIKGTHFMKKSTMLTVKKMPRFFEIEGRKQIKRLKLK